MDFLDLVQVQSGPSTPGQILDWIDFRVGAWAGSIQQALSTWAINSLAVAIALMIVWYGYRIMFGMATGSLDDIARKLGLIILIIVFTVSSITWWPALFGLVTLVPEQLANLVLVATGVTTGAEFLIDEIFERGIQTGFDTISQAGFTGVAGWIIGLFIIIGTFLFVGLMFALVGMSHIVLALLLGLAPVMVIALCFDLTRSIFEKWLGLLLNYSLIPLLAYTVGTLIAVGAQGALAGAGGGSVTFEVVIPYLTWCTLGFMVLLQVPGVAASLGGGLVMQGAQAVAQYPWRAAMRRLGPKWA